MSVTARLSMKINATEVLATSIDSVGTPTVLHNNFDYVETINAGTTVPATKVSEQVVALIAGAKTIDLTALVGVNGGVVNGTGLKVQAIKIKNLGANLMTITFGASNPYNLMGADFKITLQPGQRFMFTGNDATPDVGSGAKNIDVAGTLVQTFQLEVVLG